MLLFGIAADFRDVECGPNLVLTSADIAHIREWVATTENACPLLLEHNVGINLGQVRFVATDRFLYAVGFIWEELTFFKNICKLSDNYTARTRRDNPRCKTIGPHVTLQVLYPNLSLGAMRSKETFAINELSIVGLGAKTNTTVAYGPDSNEVLRGVMQAVPPEAVRLLRMFEKFGPPTCPPGAKVGLDCSMEYLMANLIYYTQMGQRRQRLKKEFAYTRFNDEFLSASATKSPNSSDMDIDMDTLTKDVAHHFENNKSRKKMEERMRKQELKDAVIEVMGELRGGVGKKRKVPANKSDDGDNDDDDGGISDDDDDDAKMAATVVSMLRKRRKTKHHHAPEANITSPEEAMRKWSEDQARGFQQLQTETINCLKNISVKWRPK